MIPGGMGGAAESSYPLSLSPIPAACARMRSAKTALEILGKYLVAQGSCLNLGRSPERLSHRPPMELARPATGFGTSPADTAWYYIACTEVIHPIGSNNVTDMFPPDPYDEEDTSRWCQEIFAPQLSPGRLHGFRPSHLPTAFGMADR